MATQVKSIPLKGISNSPSDFLSEDGELDVAINVVHDNGSISPAMCTSPKLLFKMDSNFDVVYMHSNSLYKNFIVNKKVGNTNKYYFVESDSEFFDAYAEQLKEDHQILSSTNVVRFTAIGNILIANDGDKTKYYRYKPNSSEQFIYKYIGNEVPFFKMQFSLEPVSYANPNIGTDDVDTYEYTKVGLDHTIPNGGILTDDGDINILSDASIGLANKFQAWCNDNGYFSQPFFVRYAVRMYDGSLTKISAPILMTPCSRTNPQISIKAAKNKSMAISCVGTASRLKYTIDSSMSNVYDEWSDIVLSVDIFVSSPVYTYDQSGKVTNTNYIAYSDFRALATAGNKSKVCEQLGLTRWYNGVTVCGKAISSYKALADGGSIYNRIIPKFDGVDTISFSIETNSVSVLDQDGNTIIKYSFGATRSDESVASYDVLSCCVELPSPVVDINKQLESVSTFYLLFSIDTEKINSSLVGTDKYADVSKNYLESLNNKEVLVSDYASHDTLISSFNTEYNSRINMACVRRVPFSGFSPVNMFQKYNHNPTIVLKSILVYIEDTNRTHIVKIDCNSSFNSTKCLSSYFFYPNIKAKKAEFYWEDGDGTVYKDTRNLHIHSSISNAAYSFLGIEGEPTLVEFTGTIPSEDYTYIEEPNVLYTSEVNNPFVFKAANVEQIGNGKIIALVPQAVALSQGQFGQYPMTCFTTDGIWALSVSETGGWAAKQPFSRDVVLNEDEGNILQLDRQIMFATNRGLMLMSGTNIDCISDSMNNVQLNGTMVYGTDAMNIFDFLSAKVSAGELSDIDSVSLVNPNFKEFIGNAVFKYDYTHQRIIIGNQSHKFAFVYNMNDKSWASIPVKMLSSVNSYPECYSMLGTGINYTYEYDEEGSYEGVSFNVVERKSNCIVFRIEIEGRYDEVYYKVDDGAEIEFDMDNNLNVYKGDTVRLRYTKDGEYSNGLYIKVDDTNTLVDFSRSGSSAYIYDATSASTAASNVGMPLDGFIITRPIKLGDPTSRKVIRTINVQGKFQKDHVDIIMLGCTDNNMNNWFILSSCKGSRLPFRYGTPFKYFRVALVTHLKPMESISSLTIEYEVKELNKMRQ